MVPWARLAAPIPLWNREGLCPSRAHPTKGHKAFGNRYLAPGAAGWISAKTRVGARNAS